MAKRQNRPEDFTLPLLDMFLPPHIADGQTNAFYDWVQAHKSYGSPLPFVNAHKLLFSMRIVANYKLWALVDSIGSLRREQFTAPYLEMAAVLRYGRNYAWLELFSDIATIALFIFCVSAFFLIYEYNVVTYWLYLPVISKCLFSLMISVAPFVHKITQHKTIITIIKNISLICRTVGYSKVYVLMLVCPLGKNIKPDLGVFHLWADTPFLCILTASLSHGLIRCYVCRSVQYRSIGNATTLQATFDKGSGHLGWYSGKAGVRNLLPTTKEYLMLPAPEVVTIPSITDADIDALIEEMLQTMKRGGHAPSAFDEYCSNLLESTKRN
jgi:hypothetical protein